MVRKENRFLLYGMLPGIALGTCVTLAIVRRPKAPSEVTSIQVTMNLQRSVATSGSSGRNKTDETQSPTIDNPANTTDGVVAIQVDPNRSVRFSPALIKAIHELTAAGEPPDVVVNLVVSEVNRQRRGI
ncbi:MAG TPA: hypothetical protein VL171_02895 [Verrucomicrobiae bacterium]|nr:hypothetical protein [Verrucomicrobiae bacterium]